MASNIIELKMATRQSKLALVQANIAKELLEKTNHEVKVTLVHMLSQGDTHSLPIAEAGGKDQFVETLRKALISGEANCACHSLKDVGQDNDQFHLAAFLPRDDPRDALIGKSIDELKKITKATVATSSPRRNEQLKEILPDVNIIEIRGNIDTRVNKLSNGVADALMLACAGLDRLDMQKTITQRLEVDIFIPAPGQGTIALECLASEQNIIELLTCIDNPSSRKRAIAERACASQVAGDCHTPLGVHAILLEDGAVSVKCMLSYKGNKAEASIIDSDPHQAGIKAATNMLNTGGKEILKKLSSNV